MASLDFNPFHLLKGPWFCAMITSWVIAQSIKMGRDYFHSRKLKFGYLMSTGGMPSAHSSMATALFLSVGMTEGFCSATAMCAFGLTAFVLYDAAFIRRESGRQAEIINEMVEKLKQKQIRMRDIRLKELVGHTGREVLGGIVTGTIVAYLVLFLWFWK